MKQCIARASVFSGRPDPTWLVGLKDVGDLEEIWNHLEPSVAMKLPESKLGYRGVSIKCADNIEFTAYCGFVRRNQFDQTDWKRDEERLFERLLLSTAPTGLLPSGIVRQ